MNSIRQVLLSLGKLAPFKDTERRPFCSALQGPSQIFDNDECRTGNLLETLISFTISHGQLRRCTGTKASAIRQARFCYDHLAGAFSVRLFDSLTAAGAFEHAPKGLGLTEAGSDQIEYARD